MSTAIRKFIKIAIATAAIRGAFAQNIASLSGRVAAEDGHAVRATVTLSFAAPRSYPSPPRRVLTDANGAFRFAKLPAGRYALCAQVAATEAAPTNSPYVDTCVWGSTQSPISVSAGQQVTGIVYTAPKGALLTIPIADPDHVLPAASSKAPSPLEPEFQLMLKGPDGLYRHARFSASTAAGRNYQIVVPLGAALAIKVSSTVANIFDQTGSAIAEGVESAFPAISAASLTQASLSQTAFTLHKK